MSLRTNRINPGVEALPRNILNGAISLSSGTARLVYFTPEFDFAATKINSICTSAAGATPTLCRMALYTVNTDGSLSVSSSHPNDTTLWSAAGTIYTKTLTTPFTVKAGFRYAMGALCVTGAALPQLACVTNNGPAALYGTGFPPRLTAAYGSQSDIGALAAPTGGNDTIAQLWLALT